MNILIIDDERPLVESLARYLTKQGHQFESASNGKSGLELFLQKSNTFDLILIDLQIPILNGLKVVQHIREQQFTTPFILMSGYIEEDIFNQAKQLGALDCLLKPFKLAQLKNILEKLQK